MREITQAELDNWFTYHNDPDAIPKYVAVREGAKAFARIILDNSPSSADQTAAMRKLRETVMTVNAAIACQGT